MIGHKESMGRVRDVGMFDKNVEFDDERDYMRRAADRGQWQHRLPWDIKRERRFVERRMTDRVVH